MELFQVYWDDQRNLFLELKKDQLENQLYLPGTIKRINLKYEISRNNKRDPCFRQEPYLISVRNFYFFNEFIAFSIDMSEINDTDNLQIKIVNVTIILYTGKKLEYTISRTFIMSEICVNDECYSNFKYEEIKTENKTEDSFLHEKIFQELETDLKNNKERSTFIYEKKTSNNSISHDLLVNLVGGNTEAINNIVDQLKELNSTLKNMSLNNIGYVSPGLSQTGPPKRMTNWKTNPNLSNPRLAIKAPGKLPFLPELKELMKDDASFHNYLKPMSEEELTEIMLDDEELEKKQEITIKRQIKRLEKEYPQELLLQNLKEPI